MIISYYGPRKDGDERECPNESVLLPPVIKSKRHVRTDLQAKGDHEDESAVETATTQVAVHTTQAMIIQ